MITSTLARHINSARNSPYISLLAGTMLGMQVSSGMAFPTHDAIKSLFDRQVAAVQISGTVADANGERLPGVTVLVQGTAIGTATDLEGRFSLDVPEGAV